MNLGESITKEREKQRISKLELSIRSTVNRNTISQIENNVRIPHPESLSLIAKALHVPVSQFTNSDDCILIAPYESADLTHITTLALIKELLIREELINDR